MKLTFFLLILLSLFGCVDESEPQNELNVYEQIKDLTIQSKFLEVKENGCITFLQTYGEDRYNTFKIECPNNEIDSIDGDFHYSMKDSTMTLLSVSDTIPAYEINIVSFDSTGFIAEISDTQGNDFGTFNLSKNTHFIKPGTYFASKSILGENLVDNCKSRMIITTNQDEDEEYFYNVEEHLICDRGEATCTYQMENSNSYRMYMYNGNCEASWESFALPDRGQKDKEYPDSRGCDKKSRDVILAELDPSFEASGEDNRAVYRRVADFILP